MQNLEENKNQIENNEVAKPVVETIEKEISQEEFFDFLNIEENNFKQETRDEIKNLNSIGLDDATFQEVKNETGVEGELQNVDKEVESLVQGSKIEPILGESKEISENKPETTKQIEKTSEQQNKYISQESIKSIEMVLDAQNNLHTAQERLGDLKKNSAEMMHDEYVIKTKCAEIEILKARGDILINKKDIPDEVIEKFRQVSKDKKAERVIFSESETEKEVNKNKERFLKNFDLFNEKIVSNGYDLESIIKFEYSENEKEQNLFKETKAFWNLLHLEEDFEVLLDSNPNSLLDFITKVKSSYIQKEIFEKSLKDQSVHTKKIVDVAFSNIINNENKLDVLNDLKNRLQKDRQEALKNLPVDEVLDSWEMDTPENSGWGYREDNQKIFAEKIGEEIDELRKEGRFKDILKIKERIDNLNSKTDSIPYFSQSQPKWLRDMNLNDEVSSKFITKNLDEESFKNYFDRNNTFIPFNLVPDSFSKEEKEKYYGRVFSKKDLNGKDVLEYSKLVNKDIIQIMIENQNALFAVVLKNQDIRKIVMPELHAYYEDKNNSIEASKHKHTKNILESFLVKDSPSELPPQIVETLEKFENNYGDKGRDLIALAVSSYGIENPESFQNKMESIAQVLDKYNPDTIPSSAKVSMGIEYEITDSIASQYQENSVLGYKNDIVLASESANIAKGKDAVHEIALKPNYNPYMIMAEMKLLQEGGFLDLNFENYPNASRGYHLSLVGDNGLSVDENMFFLNNIMTMSQLTGITAGKEINNTKNIHSKNFENFSDTRQKGERCEIKGMATDSVEQFEKAVITAHHAGIAIQLANKYTPNIIQFAEIGNTSQEFEKILIDTNSLVIPFESDQERDIVYEWIKLKKSTADAIGEHNESFVNSEFNGFVLNKDGTYIDTGEHIDIMRNKKLVDQEVLQSQEFKDKIHLNPGDVFESQKVEFVNALTNINNIFLKPPQGVENSSINAKAVLDTVKQEGYGDILDGKAQESIFENGGNFRDGYYYTQGASEEMIIHKSQILLNHFNKNMDVLLATKGVKRTVAQEELITA